MQSTPISSQNYATEIASHYDISIFATQEDTKDIVESNETKIDKMNASKNDQKQLEKNLKSANINNIKKLPRSLDGKLKLLYIDITNNPILKKVHYFFHDTNYTSKSNHEIKDILWKNQFDITEIEYKNIPNCTNKMISIIENEYNKLIKKYRGANLKLVNNISTALHNYSEALILHYFNIMKIMHQISIFQDYTKDSFCQFDLNAIQLPDEDLKIKVWVFIFEKFSETHTIKYLQLQLDTLITELNISSDVLIELDKFDYSNMYIKVKPKDLGLLIDAN